MRDAQSLSRRNENSNCTNGPRRKRTGQSQKTSKPTQRTKTAKTTKTEDVRRRTKTTTVIARAPATYECTLARQRARPAPPQLATPLHPSAVNARALLPRFSRADAFSIRPVPVGRGMGETRCHRQSHRPSRPTPCTPVLGSASSPPTNIRLLVLRAGKLHTLECLFSFFFFSSFISTITFRRLLVSTPSQTRKIAH